MNAKKQIRKEFRDAVFKRDGYRCVCCGFQSTPEHVQEELDAHHIKPRGECKNGGYVIDNGISLCKFPAFEPGYHENIPSCHEKAEEWLKTGKGEPGYSPDDLLEKIGK